MGRLRIRQSPPALCEAGNCRSDGDRVFQRAAHDQRDRDVQVSAQTFELAGTELELGNRRARLCKSDLTAAASHIVGPQTNMNANRIEVVKGDITQQKVDAIV